MLELAFTVYKEQVWHVCVIENNERRVYLFCLFLASSALI